MSPITVVITIVVTMLHHVESTELSSTNIFHRQANRLLWQLFKIQSAIALYCWFRYAIVTFSYAAQLITGPYPHWISILITRLAARYTINNPTTCSHQSHHTCQLSIIFDSYPTAVIIKASHQSTLGPHYNCSCYHQRLQSIITLATAHLPTISCYDD